MQTILKLLILVVFLAVLISLGSAVFSLMRDKPASRRLVNSFTVRICLSILLFFLLFVAYYTGALQPHALLPYNQ
jgi:hypothetical protein